MQDIIKTLKKMKGKIVDLFSLQNPILFWISKVYKQKIGRVFFDKYQIKENYINKRTLEWSKSHLKWKVLMETLEGIKNKKTKILDIGCNHGSFTILLAREGYNVTGIDIFDKAISYAKARLAQEHSSVKRKISFETRAIHHLPYQNHFDLAFMFDVLEHLYPEDVDKSLQRINRCLKPGGKLLILVPHKDAYDSPEHVVRYTPVKVKNLLLNNNFIIEDVMIERRGDHTRDAHNQIKALARKSENQFNQQMNGRI